MRNRFALRLPLWVVLNVPVTLILLVSAALIAYLGIQNGTAVASDLTKQLIAESAARTQDNLDSFLAVPEMLNKYNVAAMRLKQLDFTKSTGVQQEFLAQLLGVQNVAGITYANEQQEYVSLVWRTAGPDLSYGESSAQTGFTLNYYYISQQGERGKLLAAQPDYDPRIRPWYQAAVTAGHATWTPIYIWTQDYGMGIDAVTPVYTDNGALLGVLDTSLYLSGISKYLQSAATRQNGDIFIVDDAGLLVASSTMPQPYERVNGVLQRFDTLTSSDPLIQGATKQVTKQFGGWSAVGGSQQFEFEQSGGKSLAQVIPYQRSGLRWWIVVAVPEATYLDPINDHIRQTLVLILVSLVISVGLLTLLSRRITHPILRLSQASKAIAAGNWSERVPISHQTELGELAMSFNQMADQLQESTLSLSASEARLRAIFDNSAEAITVSNKDGFVTYNAGFHRIFGYDSGTSLVGKATLGIIAPGERERGAETIRQRLAGGSAPAVYETRGLKQDGSEFDMEVRATTFVQNGERYILGLLHDITDRKRAEAALRESEARLRAIFENSTEAIAVSDKNGFVTVNPAFQTMLGSNTPDELIGKQIIDSIAPSERARIADYIRQRSQGQSAPQMYETRGLKQDGSEFDMEVRVTTFVQNGEQYSLALLRDITERKRAEEVLYRQNEYLTSLRETTLDLLSDLQLDSLLEHIMERAARLLGTTDGYLDLVEPGTSYLKPIIGLGTLAESLQYAVQKGESITGIVWETGKPMFVEDYDKFPRRMKSYSHGLLHSLISVPLLRGSEVIGVVGIGYRSVVDQVLAQEAIDTLSQLARFAVLAIENARLFSKAEAEIAERIRTEEALRDSETRFRTIIESAPIGISFSRQGKTLYANSQYSRMFGYQEPAEVVGYSIAQQIAPEYRDELLERALRREQGETVPTHYETMGLRKDGSQLPFEIWLTTMAFADGQANVGFHLDLTERKQIEAVERDQHALAEALRDTAEALVRSLDPDEVMENILGNISRVVPHDSSNFMLIKGDVVQVVYTRGWSPVEETTIKELRFPLDTANIQEMLRTRSPLLIRDTATYPGWLMPELPTRSYLGVPIQIHGNIIGFLSLDSRQSDFYTARHAERLGAFADQAAIAIENAQLYEELRRHAQQLEQKVNERTIELQRSKEHVEAILNSSSDGIILIDGKGAIQQTNTAFDVMYASSPDNYLKVSLTDLVSSEDQDALRQAMLGTANGKTNRLEVHARRKDGTVFESEIGLSPVMEGNTASATIVCILHDITERKQAEAAQAWERELTNSLMASIPDAIYFKDRESRFLRINQASAKMLGVAHPEQALGKTDFDFFTVDSAQGAFNDEQIIVHTGTPLISQEVAVTWPDRAPMWISTTKMPLYDVARQIIGTFGVSRDITERKQVEAAIEQRNLTLTALQMGALEIAAELDIPALLSRIMQRAVDLLNAQRGGGIYLYDSKANVLRLEAVSGINEGRVGITVDPGEGVAGHVLQNGQSLIVNDYTHWDRHVSILILDPPSTVMGVPLIIQGQVVGVLQVIANSKERTFTADDVTLAEMFAAQAATALHNARLYSAAQREIAERKRTEQALRVSEERFRQIAENFDQVLFVSSADEQQMIYVNPHYEDQWGKSRESLYDTPNSYLEVIHPDDLDFVLQQNATKRYLEEGLADFEYRISPPNRGIHWVRSRRFPIRNDDGTILLRAGIIEDITERKRADDILRESEEKYRFLIESMRGGLAMYDVDHRLTYMNDRFCELLGYSRGELIGKRLHEYVDEVVAREIDAQLDRRRQGESTSYEIIVKHKDGHAVTLLVAGSPLYDKIGEYVGSFSVNTDITAQKQAEVALRQALAAEKELGDLKTRFVSMASHEFRTPLATIGATTDTLRIYRNKMSGEQIDQKLTKIKEQIGYLKDIMDDVLLLARMQARRVEFEPSPLDANELCQTVIDEFRSRPDVHHQIVYTAGGTVQKAKLDKKLMRQLITNLISNAIKYSESDKTIAIHLNSTPEIIELCVADEGIGIPDGDLKHLFEPFHRARNVGSISGTGLGLVITKEAVDMHGGTITVESQVGVGTTFTVQIPAVMAQGDNNDTDSGD